ncbi:hypothetical protein Zmor_019725 [Zophobas morio]|uniref:Cytochrome P450 4C1 n=1 Tax=Zophobas morio TaxID=2755281 RepID=A0AA38M956_9CUCU|nr:hypothetical protein Zmor_019725 [Zophobas morio]
MDFLFLALLTVFALSLKSMLQWYQRRKKIWDGIEKFGGEKWYPIVGTCLDVITAPRNKFYEIYAARNNKHGPIFRTWMGSIPAVHIMKAEHLEPVLNSTSNLRKGDFYTFIEPWLAEGLISSSNIKKWHHHRRLITPTFHFSILDNMGDVMSEKAQLLAELLEKKADGQYFDIYPFLTHCELDIICGSVLEQRYQVKFILGQKIGKCGDDDQTLLCVLMKPVLTEIIQKILIEVDY